MTRSLPAAIDRCRDVPGEPHYAALVERSFSESDGYGGTNSCVTLGYGNEEQLKAWILDADTPKYGSPTIYKIIRITPVTIHKHVEVIIA